MGRGSKYFEEIQRLLEFGYNKKQIVAQTGCSSRTVERVISKLKTEARYEFKHLLEHDYLWKYQQTIENFDRTIQQLNEEIVKMDAEYEILKQRTLAELQSTPDSKGMIKATLLSNLAQLQTQRTNELIKLTAQRDKATSEKAKVYNQGPVVNAIDDWVNRTNPSSGELQTLAEVEDMNNDPDTTPMLEAEELNTNELPVSDNADIIHSNEQEYENIPKETFTDEDWKLLKDMEDDL